MYLILNYQKFSICPNNIPDLLFVPFLRVRYDIVEHDAHGILHKSNNHHQSIYILRCNKELNILNVKIKILYL